MRDLQAVCLIRILYEQAQHGTIIFTDTNRTMHMICLYLLFIHIYSILIRLYDYYLTIYELSINSFETGIWNNEYEQILSKNPVSFQCIFGAFAHGILIVT